MTLRSRWTFVFAVILILIVVQTPAPTLLLQNIISHEDAVRLTQSLRSGVPGILVALFITAAYEINKSRLAQREIDESLAKLQDVVSEIPALLTEHRVRSVEDALDTISPLSQVQRALVRAYRKSDNVGALAEMVLPRTGRPLVRDVEMYFRIFSKDSSGLEWNLETQYQMTVAGEHQVLAAVCVGTKTYNQLIDECPFILFLLEYESEAGMRHAAEALTTHSAALGYMVTDEHGRYGRLNWSNLDAVPTEQYAALGVPTEGHDGSPIILLRKEIANPTGQDAVIITRTSGSFPATSRFCFYQEPYPAYVRKVIFDWTGLSRPQGTAFHCIPFYDTKGSLPNIVSESGRFELPIEQWLTGGQGVLLTW